MLVLAGQLKLASQPPIVSYCNKQQEREKLYIDDVGKYTYTMAGDIISICSRENKTPVAGRGLQGILNSRLSGS